MGATYPEEAALLRDIMPHSFFLVPGIGTQQGDISQLHHFYNADGMGAIFNVSRGVMFHQIEAEDVTGSIVRNVHTYNTLLAEVAP